MRSILPVLLLFTTAVFIFDSTSALALKNDGFNGQAKSCHKSNPADTSKRRALLAEILNLLDNDLTHNGPVSYRDQTFKDWLNRTGELPPDFDKMPSIPYLPDPLVSDEGGRNIPVTNEQQWNEKRAWMKEALQYYITGTFPAAPQNLQSKIISEKKVGEVTIRQVELSFGPGNKAKIVAELMIPPGEGPFPVFMTQWNHFNWAMIAVRRGYIGCRYSGADAKDDTENYGEIWNGEYDFTRLMRRAFGASRVIDYLFTLPVVNQKQIGITGHSRNGKQSLWAAAFDERIAAIITSSGGSGAEVPWRYSRHKYGCEDIGLLSAAQPAWLHPRLRFFIGRENKLPVDQNLFMALVAPRGLMLSSSIRESDGNPWGIEMAYENAKKVYEFLGNSNHLAVRLRDGRHGLSSRDIEDYVDFFDYCFGRSSRKPENRLFYQYSFEKWKQLSKENVNPLNYPVAIAGHLLKDDKGKDIRSTQDWEKKRNKIQQQISWLLGDTPPGITNNGPLNFQIAGESNGEDNFGNMIPRPGPSAEMGRLPIAPGAPIPGFGEGLYGYLYYPKTQEEKIKQGTVQLPAIIFLHQYDYSQGFFDNQGFDHSKLPFLKKLTAMGYAVFLYDMIGFGNRIEEGTDFYSRYPHWSKMGKMVTDLRSAVDALSHLNFIDSSKISVMGYSLGGTIGLYGAALDKRVSQVISVSGFTPMRTDTPDKGTEGTRAYSHLHGLLPRLGFFAGNENRIPVDYDEILAAIAPRRVLIIAPAMDEDADADDTRNCVKDAEKIYNLYGKKQHLQLYSPRDYNRFSFSMQDRVIEWLQEKP